MWSLVRQRPRLAGLYFVRVVPTVAALLGLSVARPQAPPRPAAQRQYSSHFGEYERPGRHVAQNPADDEAFLRQCRERAEEQRRIARQQRLARDPEQPDER